MRLPNRSPSRRPGMSLMEVLVALAIFVMAFAALGQLVQFGMEQAVEADRQTTATRLAQSKLGEVEAGVISIDGDSGDFTEQETSPDGTALWSWTAVSTAMSYPNTYEVSVTVTSKTSGNFSVTLSQIVIDPTYMGTAAPSTAPTTTTGSKP